MPSKHIEFLYKETGVTGSEIWLESAFAYVSRNDAVFSKMRDGLGNWHSICNDITETISEKDVELMSTECDR